MINVLLNYNRHSALYYERKRTLMFEKLQNKIFLLMFKWIKHLEEIRHKVMMEENKLRKEINERKVYEK